MVLAIYPSFWLPWEMKEEVSAAYRSLELETVLHQDWVGLQR